jgi:hypothetical protein
MSPHLKVRRLPDDEEPYHAELVLTASNGAFAGSTNIYCRVEEIAEIGRGLKNFPSKIGDEYRYEYGSETPEWHRYLLLRAYTVGGVGQCALQIVINHNRAEPDDAYCRFSILVEAAMLNRLGDLFEKFAELQHLELEWSLSGGCLHEQYQQPAE